MVKNRTKKHKCFCGKRFGNKGAMAVHQSKVHKTKVETRLIFEPSKLTEMITKVIEIALRTNIPFRQNAGSEAEKEFRRGWNACVEQMRKDAKAYPKKWKQYMLDINKF